jgi:hypothetical protein
MSDEADIVIVGAGAAGLMTAIQAGRLGSARIVLVDGARKIGAKILVAGGGRCNVTHHEVTEAAFAGGSRNAIRKVLKQFGVAPTIAFFAELGVKLEREETGKLFPTTNRARTVLDALLGAVKDTGVVLRHPFRVQAVERNGAAFRVVAAEGEIACRRVVLATGGQSLPKSGSDGHGYVLATSLGHSLTPRIDPGLVPLLLPADHPLTTISGTATSARLEVHGATGKRLVRLDGPLLCTHFGISGPVVLDVSRHWLNADGAEPDASLVADLLPQVEARDLDQALQDLGGTSPRAFLCEHLPQRLADVLLRMAGLDPQAKRANLTRPQRKALVAVIKVQRLPVTGPRGWTWAEVTAGGVPLSEVHLDSMASRACPGLHLVGEILDVDGRIGGFNFQWAWSSGTVAGRALGRCIQ